MGYCESLIAGVFRSLVAQGDGILAPDKMRTRKTTTRVQNTPHMGTDAEELKPRSKGIYLLPNLLTTACMFSGFYAIVAAIDKHFAAAGPAIFVAMIFDTLDGRMAR